MAKYKCLACGDIFEYCRRCVVTPVIYKEEGFCSKECSGIFNTLSKHSCNLITADEALAELAAYNIDKSKLSEDIIAHIERIKSEATVKADTFAIAEEEKPAVKRTNKK
jgi:hypothetical protein